MSEGWPNLYEDRIHCAHWNGHESGNEAGDAALREALKDPVEQLKWRQAELCKQLKNQIKDEQPPEDIEGLIQQHIEDTRAVTKPKTGPKPMTTRITEYKGLRPAVIHQLAREGEVVNLISESKVGKSWEANRWAITKCTGGILHGRFNMMPGRVLYLDNELHEETSNFRFLEVAKAMGRKQEEWADQLDVDNFRGRLLDINGIGKYLLDITPGTYKLVFIDAGYRALQQGADENSNSDITNFYNSLDSFAMRLGCAIVVVHHSSKGSQGSKRVTDVWSGAGSQSRAADSHIVLRAHREDDVFVFDAALRSWPKIDPFCLRWKWPLWTPDDNLDPTDLRTDRPKKPPKADAEGIVKQVPWDAERFAAELITDKPLAKAAIIAAASKAGLSERKADSFIKQAVALGLAHKWPTDDWRVFNFANVKAPDPEPEAAQ